MHDTDAAFLQALASTKRGKRREDDFDREFNNLRISKPEIGQDAGDDADEEPSRIRTLVKMRLSQWHLPLFLVSFVPVVVFHFTRHWLTSNAIALCLALNAVSLMGLDSFLTGSIMLGGLFLYDIFWVFGTAALMWCARR